jgi:hypothetical protein
MHIGYWREIQKDRDLWEDEDVGWWTDLWEDQDVGWWTILKRILERGWNGVDWIDMAQGRVQGRALVNTALNLRVS